MGDQTRVLAWSRSGPGTPSGSPAVLLELLRCLTDSSVEFVCEQRPMTSATRSIDAGFSVRSWSFFRLLWPFRRGSRLVAWARMIASPSLVILGLLRVAAFRPHVLLAMFFDPVWISTAFLVGKISGTPILWYVHDPFEEARERRSRFSRLAAHWLESLALRNGKVIVLYPSLQRLYMAKHGISARVVRHMTRHERGQRSDTAARPFRCVGFAGTIYANNTHSLRDLARATRALGLEVRAFTNASEPHLEEAGLRSSHVTTAFESDYDRLLARLGECDLLFLPLAFRGDRDLPTEALRHVIPTKAVDYLLAGPPILVHCPADYELASFFRDTGAAHLLHEEGEDALRNWLWTWREGGVAPTPEANVLRALSRFGVVPNMEQFEAALREVTERERA